jgi:putative transposase
MLRKNGLKAIQPRSFVSKTTQSHHPHKINPNLLVNRPAPVKLFEV